MIRSITGFIAGLHIAYMIHLVVHVDLYLYGYAGQFLPAALTLAALGWLWVGSLLDGMYKD